MTEIAFHFNAPDRLVYACRLLRKAYLKGARVWVLADPPLAAALDQQLWTFAGTEFVPHCRETADAALQARTPVVISEGQTDGTEDRDVLVNLCDRLPASYARFARVIEVITPDPTVRQSARERWKQYKSAGFEPQHLDLQKTPVR